LFDELISVREPPEKRADFCIAGFEHHLAEDAVMESFALHLLRTMPDLRQVAIHPDGEHGKKFDFAGWLGRQGFSLTKGRGTTSYGGLYSGPSGQTLLVNPSPEGSTSWPKRRPGASPPSVRAASSTPGTQVMVSRLRKGLCEAVGMLLQNPVQDGQRQVAVVPCTPATEALGRKTAPRAQAAGIEIALVDGRGNVIDLA
jgi:hypothetical protein